MKPAPPIWLFLAFPLIWLVATGMISLLGGWRTLASKFGAPALPQGQQQFHGQSLRMGFLGGYSNAINVTISDDGFGLVPVLLFRFAHQPLAIPWTAVRSCQTTKGWFLGFRTRIELRDGYGTLEVRGAAGEALQRAWGAREPQ
jgi:hypothetical protein